MGRRRFALMVAGTGAVLGLAAVAAFLVTQGLGRADQWSSVVQLFLAALGLVLSVTGWSLRSAGTADKGAPADEPSGSPKGDEYIFRVHGRSEDWTIGRGPHADADSVGDRYEFDVHGPALRWRVGRLGRSLVAALPAGVRALLRRRGQ